MDFAIGAFAALLYIGIGYLVAIRFDPEVDFGDPNGVVAFAITVAAYPIVYPVVKIAETIKRRRYDHQP